jgi:hypothetical protein
MSRLSSCVTAPASRSGVDRSARNNRRNSRRCCSSALVR